MSPFDPLEGFADPMRHPQEMPEYDQLFTTIENHDLTIEQLTVCLFSL